MELPIIQSSILLFNPARFSTIPCTAAFRDQSVPVSAFNLRLPPNPAQRITGAPRPC